MEAQGAEETQAKPLERKQKGVQKTKEKLVALCHRPAMAPRMFFMSSKPPSPPSNAPPKHPQTPRSLGLTPQTGLNTSGPKTFKAELLKSGAPPESAGLPILVSVGPDGVELLRQVR